MKKRLSLFILESRLLMLALIAWCSLVLFFAFGLLGVFLPALPGIVLIFVGALIHKLLLPEFLSWWTLLILGAGVGVTFGLDLLGSAVGARWGGASKLGMVGLFVGSLVGLFFLPAGILLGPLLGVFLGEVFVASRPISEGARAGIGATLGIALSTFLKFLLGLFLISWTVCDLLFFR